MWLTGHYRRFVMDHGKCWKSLSNLLKRVAFLGIQWQATLFKNSNKKWQTPVLALPNFKDPFVIETDASWVVLSAVLIRHKHPVAFFSEVLGPKHLQLSSSGKELITILEE